MPGVELEEEIAELGINRCERSVRKDGFDLQAP